MLWWVCQGSLARPSPTNNMCFRNYARPSTTSPSLAPSGCCLGAVLSRGGESRSSDFRGDIQMPQRPKALQPLLTSLQSRRPFPPCMKGLFRIEVCRLRSARAAAAGGTAVKLISLAHASTIRILLLSQYHCASCRLAKAQVACSSMK